MDSCWGDLFFWQLDKSNYSRAQISAGKPGIGSAYWTCQGAASLKRQPCWVVLGALFMALIACSLFRVHQVQWGISQVQLTQRQMSPYDYSWLPAILIFKYLLVAIRRPIRIHFPNALQFLVPALWRVNLNTPKSLFLLNEFYFK